MSKTETICNTILTNPDQAILEIGSGKYTVEELNTTYDNIKPLQAAVWAKQIDTCDALIKAGVDVNCLDEDRNNLLHLVAHNHIGAEIRELLIDSGVDLYALNNKIKTPIELAVQKRNISFFEGLKLPDDLLLPIIKWRAEMVKENFHTLTTIIAADDEGLAGGAGVAASATGAVIHSGSTGSADELPPACTEAAAVASADELPPIGEDAAAEID